MVLARPAGALEEDHSGPKGMPALVHTQVAAVVVAEEGRSIVSVETVGHK